MAITYFHDAVPSFWLNLAEYAYAYGKPDAVWFVPGTFDDDGNLRTGG